MLKSVSILLLIITLNYWLLRWITDYYVELLITTLNYWLLRWITDILCWISGYYVELVVIRCAFLIYWKLLSQAALANIWHMLVSVV